jgi:hypothetical protein
MCESSPASEYGCQQYSPGRTPLTHVANPGPIVHPETVRQSCWKYHSHQVSLNKKNETPLYLARESGRGDTEKTLAEYEAVPMLVRVLNRGTPPSVDDFCHGSPPE